MVILEGSGATIRFLPLEPNQFVTIRLAVEPYRDETVERHNYMNVYQLNVKQEAEIGEEGLVHMGSQMIQFKTWAPVMQLYP